jgi:hypothetical protein
MGIGFQFAGRLTGIDGWSSPMIGGGTWHCLAAAKEGRVGNAIFANLNKVR